MATCLLSISFAGYASTKHCTQNNEKNCNQNKACEWNSTSKKCIDKKAESSSKTNEPYNPDMKAEDILKDTPVEEPEEAPGN